MLNKIKAALATLEPTFLQIEDESHMHSIGAESHFKVVLVSEVFTDVRKVQRHQKVYGAIGDLMQQFHGLALHTYTPDEWLTVENAPNSPKCMGGSLHDKK